MKIEKVNDNQIRCTLTKADLAERQLKLSELAYGTEKAKSLFRDMMQQAAYEFGFEAEDIPLMIEAIPLSSDCIILIITKVEYPEELDTRFSKFAPPSYDDTDIDDFAASSLGEGADDIIDYFNKIRNTHEDISSDNKKQQDFIPLPETIDKNKSSEKPPKATTAKVPKQSTIDDIDISKLYVFSQLNNITRLSCVLKDFYNGNNSLYKNPSDNKYFLIVTKSSHTPEDFNRVCNVLSEYGHSKKCTLATAAFLNEHYEPIIANNALQTLSQL